MRCGSVFLLEWGKWKLFSEPFLIFDKLLVGYLLCNREPCWHILYYSYHLLLTSLASKTWWFSLQPLANIVIRCRHLIALAASVWGALHREQGGPAHTWLCSSYH